MVKLPHWPIPIGIQDAKLGLERVSYLLDKVGAPHLNLPPVIHIAGTNGKGSTLAYLRTILEIAGYKVHTYTSPHLIRFNERIYLAGKEIDDNLLYELIEKTRIAAGDMQVTFFEGTTVAAFLAFAAIPADIVLLETGLGGRLDATNVIQNPYLSIITPISLDHIDYLGDTLAKIALEKAGIIKKNCNTVISWQPKEAMECLLKKCDEVESKAYAWGRDWDFYNQETHFTFDDHEEKYNFPHTSLTGLHQIVNASTAIAAIQLLHDFNVTKEHIEYGLTNCKWPARLERITRGVLYDMLGTGSELWLDGAHNVGGAEILAASIRYMSPALPLYVINGRSKDRDIAGFLSFFLQDTTFLCATHIKSEPLSENATVIYNTAVQMGFTASCSNSIKEAMQQCLYHAKGQKIRILICGSLYLAGDMLATNQGLI